MAKTEIKEIETATFGGGCFWCMEAIIEELEGVIEVDSGYAGGEAVNPTYRQVHNGNTGHAEVVQVRFHPQMLSYAGLLRIFMIVHNPTLRKRGKPGVGNHYRSIILYHNADQQKTAQHVIAEMQFLLDKPVITEVMPLTTFYRAEENHQNYYSSKPEKAYCQSVISPKLQKLRNQHGRYIKRKAAE